MKHARSRCGEDGIQEYLDGIAGFSVPTREEERALFQRLETGDETAREEIVQRNLRFVVKVALQFRGVGVPLPDLIQEGNIGLMQAVGRFDWRRGFRFSTYAAYYIRQEIQAALSRQATMIRLPVRKARLLGRINELCRRQLERDGTEPSVEEIAAELGLPTDRIAPLMALRQTIVSADATTREDGPSLYDSVMSDQPSAVVTLEKKETQAAVHDVLELLSPRERAVLRLRFGLTPSGDEHSLRSASKVVGLSQEGVRRVEMRALDKLRRPTLRARVENLLSA
jgi:RNA polymerase primary sigma factor